MRGKTLKIIAAAMAAVMLAGCGNSENHSVPTVIVTPTSSADTASAETSQPSVPVSSVTTSEESSEPPIVYDPSVRFVTCYKYGKKAPYPDAERSLFYSLMSQVRIVELTETGYYELENGDYIREDYLCLPEDIYNIYYPGVSGGLPGAAPEEIPDTPDYDYEPLIYDRSAALQYAAEHWSIDECLCAEFASECLTAGGLKLDLASSTALYNALLQSGLGFAFTVDLNEDGFAELPDYVNPGDVVFYYCSTENLMVHTTIYNGNSDDGFMTVYCHNPRNGGEESYAYYKTCTDGCSGALNKVVVYSFYDIW